MTKKAKADLLRKVALFSGITERALGTIMSSVDSLKRSPFIYRKSGSSPFLRELLIPFGNSGYVALFEIEDVSTVTILAVRHQREDDYH